MTHAPVRILVADDEPGMREACRRVLEANGYEVHTAKDGVEALELCTEKHRFAAALIDLKMPRMDGLEVIQHLRRHDPDIVILVITAYASIDTAVKATKLGAYDYIPKPFTPAELLLPVHNCIERRSLALEAQRLRREREGRLLEVAFERSKCSTIIHCMTDGVLVVNRDRQIVLRNAAAARIIPGCTDLPLPTPLSTIACHALHDTLAQALDAQATPTIISTEISLGDRTYMVNVSPVTEPTGAPNGAPTGAVAVLSDITTIKKLEAAKASFVAMIAHEVKAPLAAIEGYLNLILSGAAGHDPQRDHDMMQKALTRSRTLRTMVSELLHLTAIETGQLIITRAPLDLPALVADTLEAHKPQAQAKDIRLTLEDHPATACQPVLADRDAMRHILDNLIDNAIKYTPPDGQVTIRLHDLDLFVKVSIQDTGIGMSPEEQAAAFDEFYRATNDTTVQTPGTGLGLSLVKRLVELHQGTIRVHSQPGNGSTFSVAIPTEHASR